MRIRLIALLVLAALLVSCAALASELPNPEAYLGISLTNAWDMDMGDGYHGWGWEHQLDAQGRETVITSFLGDCVKAGFTYQEQTADDTGAPVVLFRDNDGRTFALQVTQEIIFLLAPEDMTLAALKPDAGPEVDTIMSMLITGKDAPPPASGTPAHDVNGPLPLNTIRVKIGGGEPVIYDVVTSYKGKSVITVNAERLDVRGNPTEKISIEQPVQCYPGDVITKCAQLKFQYSVFQNGNWQNYYCSDASAAVWGARECYTPSRSKYKITIDSIGDDGYTYKGHLELVAQKIDGNGQMYWSETYRQYLTNDTGATIELDIEFHVRAPEDN